MFDRLSPEARASAYKGALACLETLQENDFAAVFLADLSLTTIQSYTNNRVKLRAALDDVASRATSVFDRAATRRIGESSSGGDGHPSVPVVASAEEVGRPFVGPAAGSLQQVTRNLWEIMARDQQGYATTDALLAITAALGTMPGRKSVVFFAERLSIPDAVLPHFKNVIATANRGNVSVYTIDAAGLRVHSQDAAIAREVRAMGAAGLTVGLDGSNQSTLGMMEQNEDALRKDPRTSLTLLAQQTGGFLVENTNDLDKAFRQVDADRRFYYVLTYTPKNGDFDGKWRSVTVKVPNRRVTTRARSGYLAVREPANLPLLAYEGPVLAALERSPPLIDIPLRATALVFPDGASSRVVVLAGTDGSALRFESDNRTYRTDFTILARIVDDKGEVVRKASQQYRFGGSVEQIAQPKAGEILFFRQPSLEPGRYTLEVAIHDALAGKSGVRRATVVVPESLPETLQVSSLVVVRRAERVNPEERQADNPLQVGDALIYPNLGEPVWNSREKALTFYVVVTPAPGTAPRATLEMVRDGQTVAQSPLVLAAPDLSGRIRHVAQVTLETLTPGRYTLRLTVSQGVQSELRETSFDLVRNP